MRSRSDSLGCDGGDVVEECERMLLSSPTRRRGEKKAESEALQAKGKWSPTLVKRRVVCLQARVQGPGSRSHASSETAHRAVLPCHHRLSSETRPSFPLIITSHHMQESHRLDPIRSQTCHGQAHSRSQRHALTRIVSPDDPIPLTKGSERPCRRRRSFRLHSTARITAASDHTSSGAGGFRQSLPKWPSPATPKTPTHQPSSNASAETYAGSPSSSSPVSSPSPISPSPSPSRFDTDSCAKENGSQHSLRSSFLRLLLGVRCGGLSWRCLKILVRRRPTLVMLRLGVQTAHCGRGVNTRWNEGQVKKLNLSCATPTSKGLETKHPSSPLLSQANPTIQPVQVVNSSLTSTISRALGWNHVPTSG